MAARTQTLDEACRDDVERFWSTHGWQRRELDVRAREGRVEIDRRTQLRDRGPSMIDQGVRVSGAVIFESTLYEMRNGEPHLEFDIVDTEDQIGQQTPLRIVYHGPKPDLLQPHAQAIVEGKLAPDGTFMADNLLLKCPTRYEEQFPEQAMSE